ncbi:hypothetical protein AM571_CH00145 [Rhizobium etli 8C-3]|uniref:Uncharacterized protein n=3 Tax=Rhizobium/Agrobacterium group TaxID=227290 RepID=A0A4R3QWP3_9HYPH|nr:hypothetical protein AM571_CH00145 [Rhizobium etli 8C-3]TCU26893.1 hypothetical protein EV130_104510 [Rhizobium azibense]TCU38839.1 hypothetical protein EV129_104448 [Rhizobium azibense]
MTSLNPTRSTCRNDVAEDTSTQAKFPQSLMLRMMLNASRNLVRSRYPQLDLDAMSDYMKRDIGFMDWIQPHHESN